MAKRPNFLLFITDQQRADHLGCYGNTEVNTPNIDSIAANGMSFDKFYVTTPSCMPSRATLMTGRTPSANGVRHNGLPLSVEATTYVDLLRAAGYRTAHIGKSHIQNMTMHPINPPQWVPEAGDPPPEDLSDAKKMLRGDAYDMEKNPLWGKNPNRDMHHMPFYGFDHVRFANGHGDMVQGHYTGWLKERHEDHMSLRGPKNAQPTEGWVAPQAWHTSIPEEHYPTSYVTEMALEYLDGLGQGQDDSDDPFFLYCSYPDPHHPFTPPGKYWGMYDPDKMTLPENFGKEGNDETALMRHLRQQFVDGSGRMDHVYPFMCGEREAREIHALTYGMISMVDDGIGRILAKLKELGLDDDTVIMFTSDHGDFLGDHSLMLKTGLHYESVIRVPFIYSDPMQPVSGRSDELGGIIDIGHSILGRAGLAAYNGIQGLDLVDAARTGKSLARDGVAIEEDALGSHIGIDHQMRLRSHITERYRLTIIDGEELGELYDRQEDPGELNNLWRDPGAATIKAELMERMMRERLRMEDTAGLAQFQA